MIGFNNGTSIPCFISVKATVGTYMMRKTDNMNQTLFLSTSSE